MAGCRSEANSVKVRADSEHHELVVKHDHIVMRFIRYSTSSVWWQIKETVWMQHSILLVKHRPSCPCWKQWTNLVSEYWAMNLKNAHPDLVGRRAGSICGTTPPCEITTSPSNLLSLLSTCESLFVEWDKVETHSSSLRTASCKCRGTIRCFLLSRAALPANSRISAAKYSRTAAK